MSRRVALQGAVLLALAGCASTPQEHFYTLGAPVVVAAGLENQQAVVNVAIGPVTVPAIVDRPQMVLRLSDNQVLVMEQSRWAQPLEDELAQAVAADLAQQLGDLPVRVYPQNAGGDARYRVRIDVQRFESTPGAGAAIEILWAIRDAGNARLGEGRSVVREAAGDMGIDAVVAAHGRALAAVSRDIAAALRRLAGHELGAPDRR